MRRSLVFVGFLVVASLAVGTAASNAGGAPANAARDGCTCHGSASADARVTLDVPSEFLPGLIYNVSVRVTGPMALPSPVGQNTGGFAIETSGGSFAGGPDVRAEGNFATHSAAGNNQRAWLLRWTAPAEPREVVFQAAANAANGDGQMGLDAWNKATATIPARGAADPTPMTSSSAPGQDTPFVSASAAAAALASIAWVRRRV